MHLDPKTINGADKPIGKKRMLLSLMHEFGHAWAGVDHTDTPTEVAAGYPNDPYFRTLEAAGACVL